MNSKLALLMLLGVAAVTMVAGQSKTNEEQCEVGKTADGRELDNCDVSKHLKCHFGRCACADPGNQVWQEKNVRVNVRSRRSPKKGGKSKGGGGGIGKSVAAGAAGGLLGGYVGSRLANSGGSGYQSGSGGSSSSSSGRDTSTYTKVSGCFSRAGGQCVLDQYKNSVIVIPGGSNAGVPVTTAAPTTAAASSNESTTAAPAAAPVAAAQVAAYDIATYPECIQNAECKKPEVKIVNGTVVSSVSSDPRVGNCVCQDGYAVDSRGFCQRVKRSSTNGAAGGQSWTSVSMGLSAAVAAYCVL